MDTELLKFKEMRKIILTLVLSGLCFVSIAQNVKCDIELQVSNYSLDKIELGWFLNGEYKTQVLPLKSGSGVVNIIADKYSKASLTSLDERYFVTTPKGTFPIMSVDFFVEENKVVVDLDHNKWPEVSINGGKLNNDYMILLKRTNSLNSEFFNYQLDLEGADENKCQAVFLEIKKNLELISVEEENYLKNNKDSYVSLILLQPQLSHSTNIGDLESKFLQLSDNIRGTQLGEKIKKEIEELKRHIPGTKASNFEKIDQNGNIVKLSDYEGQYLLIDFWGTWCKPCRSSHVHLRELFKKYSHKGVAFLNIAQEFGENSRNGWLKAIKEDQMTWTQVLNNEKVDEFDLVGLYGVKSFPTKILINPQGEIIARFMGSNSEEIDEVFREVFGE